MAAVSTFEKSVSFCETERRNIPEDSNFHTRRRENQDTDSGMAVNETAKVTSQNMNIKISDSGEELHC
jgi:hypothetical protein